MSLTVLNSAGTPVTISTIDDLMALVGAVGGSPAANTMQDRLKTLATLLTALTTANHTDMAAITTALTTVFGSVALDQGAGAVGTHTLRVALPTDQIGTPGQRPVAEASTVVPPSDWKVKHMAASQTALPLGTGTAGDWLEGIMIIPETTSPGAVSYKDGTGTARTIFAGGTVSDVKPFYVPLGDVAVTNWNVTTGANVHIIAYGKFA